MATEDDGPVPEVAEPKSMGTGLVADGAFAVALDPFARHRGFAGSVRAGRLRSKFQWFLDKWKDPIDVRADKILDLAAFGKVPHQFLKMPRTKRNDEFPEGYEDRLKKDVERQFILRNLMRYVKTIDKGDPLEFEKRAVGVKIDLDTRAHLKDLHRKAELLAKLGTDHVRHELAWRHRMLEVMQWEQYYSAEIKQDFPGPLWKHAPETNPIPAKRIDDAEAAAQVVARAASSAVASAKAEESHRPNEPQLVDAELPDAPIDPE